MWKHILPILRKNTVKITPDENNELFLNDMKEALKTVYSKDRKGVHVSDITGCLRKKVLEHLEPRELNENQLLYYVTGAAVHGVKQDLSQEIDLGKYQVEKETNYEPGILEAHIDIFNKHLEMPIELKTARMTADQLIKYGANDTYLLQLAMYLALTESDKGLLEYILLAQKQDNYYHGFELRLSKEEREIVLKEAVKRAKLLELAKELGDPDMVEDVANDEKFNYMCKDCPYADEIRCNQGYQTKLEIIKRQQNKDQSLVRKSKEKIELAPKIKK